MNHYKDITFVHNANGARGENDRGQRFRIAILGSSTSYSHGIDERFSLGPLLKARLPFDVHIESFGTDSIGDEDLIDLVNNLHQKGLKYDLVITLHSFLVARKKKYYKNTVNFKIENSLGLVNRLLSWGNHMLRNSLLDYLLNENISSIEETSGMFFDKKIRQNNGHRDTFINVSSSFSEKDYKTVLSSIKRFDQEVQKISQNQIYIPDFFGFDINMKRTYLANYQIIKPVKGRPGYFYDPTSLARFFNLRKEYNKKAAKKLKLNFYPVGEQINMMLSEKENLYLDEIHLSEEGLAVFADLLSDLIKKVPLKIGNKYSFQIL